MAGPGVTDVVTKEQGGLFAQAGGRKDFSSLMVHKYTFLSEFQRRKTVFGVRNAIPSPCKEIFIQKLERVQFKC